MKKKTVIGIIIAMGLVVLLVKSLMSNHTDNTITVSGTIEATEVHLAFQIGGKIKELLKKEGEAVRSGEIIARLDKEELSQLKKQAETSLAEARFNSERLQQDYDRAEKLLESGAVTAQARDALKTNSSIAQTRLAWLQSALDLAAIKLGYTDLVAPIDGFITVKSAEAGEIIQPGSTIYNLSDLKNLWVTGYIKEPDLGRVKLNQKAQIKTDTYPEKTYIGYVSFISPESEFTPKQIQTQEERINRVYRIKISVDNANMELKPGMPVDARLSAE